MKFNTKITSWFKNKILAPFHISRLLYSLKNRFFLLPIYYNVKHIQMLISDLMTKKKKAKEYTILIAEWNVRWQASID